MDATTAVSIHADRAAGRLEIAWADGHHTGYYTFTMLRDRCPCPDCSARRDAANAAVGADRHEEHA